MICIFKLPFQGDAPVTNYSLFQGVALVPRVVPWAEINCPFRAMPLLPTIPYSQGGALVPRVVPWAEFR